MSDLSTSGFNNGQIVVNTGLFAGGAVIAAGATDVRFTFDGLENSAIGISELSVEGTPTTGSAPALFRAQLTAPEQAAFDQLAALEQSQVIDLGVGKATLDASASYISALLASLDANQSALIKDLGWGKQIETLVHTATGQLTLSNASALTTTQKATIKAFGIEPYQLSNAFSGNGSTLLTRLDAVAQQSTGEQVLLRQLRADKWLVGGDAVRSDTQVLSDTLAFYNGLSTDQQTAVRALDFGAFLVGNAANAPLILNGTPISGKSAADRVGAVTLFYLNNPALQQSLQDSHLFHFDNLPLDFASIVTSTLAQFDALPARTRQYLNGKFADFSFFDLANSSPNYRPLAQINNLLASANLTDAQFAILQDFDLITAVVGNHYNSATFSEELGANPLATLQAAITAYNQLSALQKNAMRELGIIGDGNVAFLGADAAGLGRLLAAYGALPGTLRVKTEHVLESDHTATSNPILGDTSTAVAARSFFFNGSTGSSGQTMVNVQFQSTGDLYVGATRFLKINNASLGTTPGFTVGAGKDLYVHAADLIDLTGTSSTNVMFSNNIRSITMAAATINLTNISFPDGAVASLNSKLGTTNFAGGSVFGKVNFNNVRYGSNALGSDADLANQSKANGNIAIGTLSTPATLPTYVAPGTNRTAP